MPNRPTADPFPTNRPNPFMRWAKHAKHNKRAQILIWFPTIFVLDEIQISQAHNHWSLLIHNNGWRLRQLWSDNPFPAGYTRSPRWESNGVQITCLQLEWNNTKHAINNDVIRIHSQAEIFKSFVFIMHLFVESSIHDTKAFVLSSLVEKQLLTTIFIECFRMQSMHAADHETTSKSSAPTRMPHARHEFIIVVCCSYFIIVWLL